MTMRETPPHLLERMGELYNSSTNSHDDQLTFAENFHAIFPRYSCGYTTNLYKTTLDTLIVKDHYNLIKIALQMTKPKPIVKVHPRSLDVLNLLCEHRLYTIPDKTKPLLEMLGECKDTSLLDYLIENDFIVRQDLAIRVLIKKSNVVMLHHVFDVHDMYITRVNLCQLFAKEDISESDLAMIYYLCDKDHKGHRIAFVLFALFLVKETLFEKLWDYYDLKYWKLDSTEKSIMEAIRNLDTAPALLYFYEELGYFNKTQFIRAMRKESEHHYELSEVYNNEINLIKQ
jgi:hypothetical protein